MQNIAIIDRQTYNDACRSLIGTRVMPVAIILPSGTTIRETGVNTSADGTRIAMAQSWRTQDRIALEEMFGANLEWASDLPTGWHGSGDES